jgi:hypothetical protein
MHTWHDSSTDRTFITQPAHPVAAGLILALALVFLALCVLTPFIERETFWLWFFAVACIGMAVFLLRMCLEAFTELVLIFDPGSRTLTVQRTRPWRRSEHAYPYQDIVDIVSRRSTLVAPDPGLYISVARSYFLEITLSASRRIRLRADGEAECERAASEAWRLIRRT